MFYHWAEGSELGAILWHIQKEEVKMKIRVEIVLSEIYEERDFVKQAA